VERSVVVALSALASGDALEAREAIMAVVKVIELLSESEDSWEAAAQEAVNRAAQTLRNIRSVYVKEFEAVVENNRVTRYRTNCKITFALDEGSDVQ
jgi:flavin-binding protein dodecin